MNQTTVARHQANDPMRNENYLVGLSVSRNRPFGEFVPMDEQMKMRTPWEELPFAYADFGEHSRTDFNGLTQDIEKALQKVRAEAEEERRLDPELDNIPETAYKDVEGFFKAIYKCDYGKFDQTIPLPDIMPLDDGEIGLEWRKGQKIFTLSFGGDGHIVLAGIFSDESRVRGILTFSISHLVAIASMIASVYPYYGY